ncbi:MAG: transcriptional regulator, TetR family [Solirubrobacterales bacterium]|nr:transcriptional regulator, TetR family [Solirubrobacterales bacterium]
MAARPTPVPVASPRRLPRAEREQQTLDVAQALFAARGYAAVTMDEVAAAVGVTKPLLYNYFGNKERLYLACLGRTADGLIARLTEAFAASADPGQGLREALRAFFAFVAAERDQWQVLYDETLPAGGQIAEHIDAYREQATALVGAALQHLDPAPDPVLLPGMAHALLGAVESLSRWWLREGSGDLSAAATADAFIALVRPGLARGGLVPSSPPPTPTGSDTP